MSDEPTTTTTPPTTVHGKPDEGLCCLCTMEDITLEDGNYVEYQSYPSLEWKPCLYEQVIVEKLLAEQFPNFIDRVKQTDCQAELRRLLSKGPPIWLEDKHALPLAQEETDTHVCKLWYASDNLERSAKLKGAVEGAERDALWAELNQFIIEEGKEAGDDDDDAEKKDE